MSEAPTSVVPEAFPTGEVPQPREIESEEQLPVNKWGEAAFWVGVGALGAFILYSGSLTFGSDAGWEIGIRIAGAAGTVVGGTLAIIFGAMGLGKNPKAWAITGLVIGIVSVLAVPSFLIAWHAMTDESSTSHGFSYEDCIGDPDTTYDQCQTWFGR